MKQDYHYFHEEILVCKFHLGSRKTSLRMCKRLCYKMLLCQNVPKEILFTGTKFHAKPSRGSGVIKKILLWGGGVHLPPPKKIKFLFMHSWMFCAPHLVLYIEYFARINLIIFKWQQSFVNKFPRDCLKQYLNGNEFL